MLKILILLHLPLLAFFGWWAHKKLRDEPLGVFFLPGLVLKLAAGALLGAIYKYVYGAGDSLSLFQAGSNLRQVALTKPLDYLLFIVDDRNKKLEWMDSLFEDWTARNLFMYKLVSMVNLLTFDNYWLTSLYFTLFSYLGLWFCANTLAKMQGGRRYALVFSFLLFPLVVFWTSGLLKESLLWGCLGICISLALSWLHLIPANQQTTRTKIRDAVLFLAAACLLGQLKYHYAAAFFPVLLTYALVCLAAQKYHLAAWKQVVFFFGFFAVMLYSATLIHPNLNLRYVFGILTATNASIAETSDIDSMIFYPGLDGEWQSVVKNIPLAVYAAFCEPLVWESDNVFKLAAALENLLLLVLLIAGGKSFRISRKNALLVCAALTYILLLAVMLALGTPNIGTLVRYKAAFMPLVVYLICSRLEIEKWVAKLRRRA